MKTVHIILMCILGLLLFNNLDGFADERDELQALYLWNKWNNASAFLQETLNQQAFEHLQRRKENIAQLKTAEDWRLRQSHVKNILKTIVGPFPEKTPLHPQIMGVIQKDGFRVEKVVFQSLPEFYVTGCLFIPDNLNGKAPAILNPIGHTDIAFRDQLYQTVILNLVKKGFIVFAFDPLSQGERLQYYDEELKKSSVGGSTAEHSYFGNQCFINGIPPARYFTWDGIRAIDYLISREEVDPERIAVTGLSGGGTQTSYIMSMDDRVSVAAPTCYITSFHRLLESIGPQDAEQNFYRGISMGLDHADFLEVRAPKPTLILTTTRDFFSIQGSRETYEEAKAAFSAFDKADHLQMVEGDYTHGYTKKTREALYAFMQKHLELPGNSNEEEIEFLTEEELKVTPTGQILTSLNSKRVFDLNKIDTEKNIDALEQNRMNLTDHLKTVQRLAPKISGFQLPADNTSFIFTGRTHYEHYRIEKYVLDSEGNCIIPLLLFIPNSPGSHTPVMIFHPNDKTHDLSDDGLILSLINKNYLVVAADLSGTGETGESLSGIKNPYTALLIGRSLPGFHAGEIIRVHNFVKQLENVDDSISTAVAYSHLTPALLHAAAFDTSIQRIALVDPLISYESIAMNEKYVVPSWSHIPGGLTAYDLPDLVALIAPRPLLLVSPTNSNLKPVNQSISEQNYRPAIKNYSAQNANRNIRILTGQMEMSEKQSRLINWLD